MKSVQPLLSRPHLLQEDEALDAYVERAATLIGRTPADLIAATDQESAGLPVAFWNVWPNENAVAAWAVLLGLDPHRIRRMTLRRYERCLMTMSPPSTSREINLLAARNWLFLAGSRYCPMCLRDGTWRVSWRMPLLASCDVHGVLLVDRCPHCGAWPRSGTSDKASGRAHLQSPRTQSRCYATPAVDRSTGLGSRPCLGDLTEAVARSAPPSALAAEDLIRAVLAAENAVVVMGEQCTPAEALACWRALCTLARHQLPDIADPLPVRAMRSPPRSAARQAELNAYAHVLVRQPSPEAASELLSRIAPDRGSPRWFRDHVGQNPPLPVASLRDALASHLGRTTTRLVRLSPYPPWVST